VSVLGQTLDLNAGQFVDRVGVALGLPFPAGPSLEKLALTDLEADEFGNTFAYLWGIKLVFSGPTTAALRLGVSRWLTRLLLLELCFVVLPTPWKK